MKIIISPSKKMKKVPINYYTEKNISENQRKLAINLLDKIKSLSKETISKKMKIKGKLLEEVINYYKNEEKIASAIGTYDGVVYKQLEIDRYEEKILRYIDKKVYILSALYGPLPAFFPINKYRLDMTMPLFEKSLYKLWEEIYNEEFKGNEIIINLASKEFSKLIKAPMMDIVFLEKNSAQVSYKSKEGRGMLLNYMIKNQIEDIEEIKKFNENEYKYNEKLSDNYRIVFKK